MNDPNDRQQAVAALSDKPPTQEANPAEVSDLARHGDPSLHSETSSNDATRRSARRGGIEWVRASDLLARGGVRVADRGANSQESVIRKMRGGMASINPVSRSGIARRSANSLPPVTAFGQTPPAPSAGRGAVGR